MKNVLEEVDNYGEYDFEYELAHRGAVQILEHARDRVVAPWCSIEYYNWDLFNIFVRALSLLSAEGKHGPHRS